jgi:hypothetical protein
MDTFDCSGQLVNYLSHPTLGPGYRLTTDGLGIGAPGVPEGWTIQCARVNRDCDKCPFYQVTRERAGALQPPDKTKLLVIREQEADFRNRCRWAIVDDLNGENAVAKPVEGLKPNGILLLGRIFF